VVPRVGDCEKGRKIKTSATSKKHSEKKGWPTDREEGGRGRELEFHRPTQVETRNLGDGEEESSCFCPLRREGYFISRIRKGGKKG